MQSLVINRDEIMEQETSPRLKPAGTCPTIVNFKSVVFGNIKVDADKIITFPHGLLGFPDMKRFIIMEYEKDTPFMCLQAVDEPCIAFVVTDPIFAKKDYRIKIKEDEVLDIGKGEFQELAVFVILSIPKDEPSKTAANLKAPLIVNMSSRMGKQIILDNEGLSVRHPIFF